MKDEMIITPKMVEELANYYRDNPTEAHLMPAFSYGLVVADRIHGRHKDHGINLPWSKTHGNIKLRPGELSIWAGVNGHGKSLLLSQLMLEAMIQGQRVVIASMEMPVISTMVRLTKQAAGNGMPTQEFIESFHDWLYQKLWLYDQLGTIKPHIMLAVLRYCAQSTHEGMPRPHHIVIDSLMKCGMGVDEYNKQKAFIDELSSFAMDTGIHIHLVAHSRKRDNEKAIMDKFDIKGAGEITDMADNVFTVWRNKVKENEAKKPTPKHDIMQKPDALLVCDKQRHGEWEGRIGLWFHKPSGQFVANEDCRPIQHDYSKQEVA